MHSFNIIIEHTANTQALIPDSISSFVFSMFILWSIQHSLIELDS